LKHAIIRWVRNNIQCSRRVCSCHVFGSFLDTWHNFDDVDVVIVFQDWNVRMWIARIKRKFLLSFHRRLHIQVFHKTQVRHIRKF